MIQPLARILAGDSCQVGTWRRRDTCVAVPVAPGPAPHLWAHCGAGRTASGSVTLLRSGAAPPAWLWLSGRLAKRTSYSTQHSRKVVKVTTNRNCLGVAEDQHGPSPRNRPAQHGTAWRGAAQWVGAGVPPALTPAQRYRRASCRQSHSSGGSGRCWGRVKECVPAAPDPPGSPSAPGFPPPLPRRSAGHGQGWAAARQGPCKDILVKKLSRFLMWCQESVEERKTEWAEPGLWHATPRPPSTPPIRGAPLPGTHDPPHL